MLTEIKRKRYGNGIPVFQARYPPGWCHGTICCPCHVTSSRWSWFVRRPTWSNAVPGEVFSRGSQTCGNGSRHKPVRCGPAAVESTFKRQFTLLF